MDFLVGLTRREDGGKEARVKEARVETEEELKGRELREEACKSTAEVGRGGWFASGSVRLSGRMIYVVSRQVLYVRLPGETTTV